MKKPDTQGYRVIGHDKNHPCPCCGINLFCKDCGVCTGCGYTPSEDPWVAAAEAGLLRGNVNDPDTQEEK